MSSTLVSAGPKLLPIVALHRHDGYIAFAHKNDDELRPFHAIRADVLESIFPEFRQSLLKDSFISINASYCLSRAGQKNSRGWPAHRTENLRYLCACYCDIDFYKLHLTLDQALEQVHYLWKFGQLPRPSVTISSGRGMWVLWFLRDKENPDRAHLGAYPDNPHDHLLLYTKINRAIGARLAFIGSDAAATDGARYVRVPGSFRTDVEEVVQWTVQTGPDDRAPVYTLKELAEFLGVALQPHLTQEKDALAESRKKAGNKSRGHQAANRNKLAAFITIKALRGGGFRKGCRNYAALIYAACLKWNGVSAADALKRLHVMATDCTPRLSDSECAGAIKSAYKRAMRKMSYRWIADVLDVTPEEADMVSQEIRKSFPAATRFGGSVISSGVPAMETRDERIAHRRSEIRRIVDTAGSVPSLRLMKDMLLAVGIDVGYVTVATDYKALGLADKNIKRSRSQNPALLFLDR